MTTTTRMLNLPGYGRESALPVATSAAGRKAWAVPLPEKATPDWPPALSAFGDRIVVATPFQFTAYGPDGKAAWNAPRKDGGPLALAGNLAYYRSRGNYLEALDRGGKKAVAEGEFPGLNEGVALSLLCPREKDFLAVTVAPPPMETAEGADPDKPMPGARISVLKSRYGSTMSDWSSRIPGDQGQADLLLPALAQPEKGQVSLFQHEVIRVDLDQRKVIGRFGLPGLVPVDWSLDATGAYCIAGLTGPAAEAGQTEPAAPKNALAAFSPEGKELWRWIDAEGSDPWAPGQPPVQAGGGRVYALTRSRLLAFDQGRPAWEFNALDAALKHGAKVEDGTFEIKDGRLLAKATLRYATALSDGTLLVVGDRTLRRLDARGKQLWALTLDADLMSPPLVDEGGSVYVASLTHLYRID